MPSRKLIPVVLCLLCIEVRADLLPETETARLAPPGKFEIGSAVEVQTSVDGQEVAVPAVIEFGVLKRLEIMVEPTLFTAILPSGSDETNAFGFGDTEVTVTGLVLEEKKWWPAVGVAGEVKIPTAANKQIGTGEPDGTFYLIFSKNVGKFDLHLDLACTIPGSPAVAQLKNFYSIAAAAEYHLSGKVDLVAEFLANTSSLPNGAAAEAVTAAEAAGEEISGTIGARFHVRDNTYAFLGASYDNNHAVLVRTGVNWKF
jgi:hypothetical protein